MMETCHHICPNTKSERSRKLRTLDDNDVSQCRFTDHRECCHLVADADNGGGSVWERQARRYHGKPLPLHFAMNPKPLKKESLRKKKIKIIQRKIFLSMSHKMNHFKVNDSVAFSIFTWFFQNVSKIKPRTHLSVSPHFSFPAAPGDHQSTWYLGDSSPLSKSNFYCDLF